MLTDHAASRITFYEFYHFRGESRSIVHRLHDRIRHQRLHAQRLYRTFLIGVELIEHEVRDQTLIMLRHREGRRLPAQFAEHLGRRSFDGLPADDGRHGGDRACTPLSPRQSDGGGCAHARG